MAGAHRLAAQALHPFTIWEGFNAVYCPIRRSKLNGSNGFAMTSLIAGNSDPPAARTPDMTKRAVGEKRLRIH